MTTQTIDPQIFVTLQQKIDADSTIRDQLRTHIDALSKEGRLTSSILAQIHNTPTSLLQTRVLTPATSAINAQITTLQSLARAASAHPFYKWNNIWQREVQALISSIQLVAWLETGTLITLEDLGRNLNVPVQVHAPAPSIESTSGTNTESIKREEDVFHITIEDYLLALCSCIEDLSRLAPNSVTLGDYARPAQISAFIKDVHAGFQLLNLKNDALRRRSDGIKYAVKKVEDVVYDLSLRGLLPKAGQAQNGVDEDGDVDAVG